MFIIDTLGGAILVGERPARVPIMCGFPPGIVSITPSAGCQAETRTPVSQGHRRCFTSAGSGEHTIRGWPVGRSARRRGQGRSRTLGDGIVLDEARLRRIGQDALPEDDPRGGERLLHHGAVLHAGPALAADGMQWEPTSPSPGGVDLVDEAQANHKTEADFPEEATDIWKYMDGDTPDVPGRFKVLDLPPDEVKGRNTWLMWCGGNEAFWDYFANHSYGLCDLLKVLILKPPPPCRAPAGRRHPA